MPKTHKHQAKMIMLCSLLLPSSAMASFSTSIFQEWKENAGANIVLLNYFRSTEVPNAEKTEMDYQYEWMQNVGLFLGTGQAQLGNSPITFGLNLGYSHMFRLSDHYPAGYREWTAGEKALKGKDCEWLVNDQGKKTKYVCRSTGSFGKLPVANAIFTWNKKDTAGHLQIGDGYVNSGMITSASNTQPTLASYRGISALQRLGRITLDGAFVTGFMSGNADDEGSHHMGDLTGKKTSSNLDPVRYDYLYTGRLRAKYLPKGNFSIAFGEAKDYLSRYHTGLDYRFNLSANSNLFLRTQYYYNKGGSLWDKTGFKDDASALNYEIRLNYDSLEFLTAMTKFKADNGSGGGAFSYGFGNAKGFLSLATDGNYHSFRRNGETAMVAGVKYTFNEFDLPRLSLQYRYHWGEMVRDSKEISDFEHAITMMYRPVSNGFFMNFKQAFYHPDQKGKFFAGDNNRSHTKLVVGYNFSM